METRNVTWLDAIGVTCPEQFVETFEHTNLHCMACGTRGLWRGGHLVCAACGTLHEMEKDPESVGPHAGFWNEILAQLRMDAEALRRAHERVAADASRIGALGPEAARLLHDLTAGAAG